MPIAESSPLATATIAEPLVGSLNGDPIFVKTNITNTSTESVTLKAIGLVLYEVKDNLGNHVTDTSIGCRVNFFSACFTGSDIPPQGTPIGVLRPGQKIENVENLLGLYEIKKRGDYTVVGYVCALNQVAGCFRTNTVILRVR
jgi:hypothetical protein